MRMQRELAVAAVSRFTSFLFPLPPFLTSSLGSPQLFSQDVLMKFVPRYSLVAEVHDGGVCTRSFHDPNGLVAAYVSEAHEHDGSLYVGSFRSPYIAKLDLSRV